MTEPATGRAGDVAVTHAGTRIQPDRDAQPFAAALSQGRLAIQRCDSCGALRWPPRSICNRCRSSEHHWIDATGRGRVASWTVTHHAVLGELKAAVPYVIVLVQLDEQDDLVLPGSYIGEIEALSIGMPVRARFTSVGDTVALLQWEPDEAPS